jgi:DNA-binding CsgD family transcriptional regulator
MIAMPKTSEVTVDSLGRWNDVAQSEPGQSALLSQAQHWTANEVSAAMVHHMDGPISALLAYLHEVKRESDLSGAAGEVPVMLRQSLEKALEETERVRAMMAQVADRFDAPNAAGANGQDVINWWKRVGEWPEQARSAPAFSSSRSNLTAREREVLSLISGGSSNKEGAHRLKISTRTFEAHRAQIMRKLGARNAADLVRMTLGGMR